MARLTLSLIFLGLLCLAPDSFARGRGCGGQPSCGFSTEGLKGGVLQLYQRTLKKGVKAISCVRPRACQARLVSYYNCVGQKGRAAKNSKHSTGDACDFSRRNDAAVNQLKQGLGTQRVNHSKKHGGGIHEQNGGGRGYKSGRSYRKRYT